MRAFKKTRGFTLVELMMSLTVLAIAAAGVVPLLSNDQTAVLRAAAELLAADIEDVQARALAEPEDPLCLVVSDDGLGWHVALMSDPQTPLAGIDGLPRVRRFGQGALASARDAWVIVPAWQGTPGCLGFDDQGAPMGLTEPMGFEMRCESEPDPFVVCVSAATGRVSILR